MISGTDSHHDVDATWHRLTEIKHLVQYCDARTQSFHAGALHGRLGSSAGRLHTRLDVGGVFGC